MNLIKRRIEKVVFNHDIRRHSPNILVALNIILRHAVPLILAFQLSMSLSFVIGVGLSISQNLLDIVLSKVYGGELTLGSTLGLVHIRV